MEIQIRRAEEKDLPEVLALVKKLAEYEKAADQVTAQIEEYIECFRSSLISADLALLDNNVVGCTLYYETFSTWKGKMLYLEDFFVLEEHRKKGIGLKLMEAFLKESKDRKCSMVKWQVLDWNEPAIQFYKKMGATIEKGWWNVKMIY